MEYVTKSISTGKKTPILKNGFHLSTLEFKNVAINVASTSITGT